MQATNYIPSGKTDLEPFLLTSVAVLVGALGLAHLLYLADVSATAQILATGFFSLILAGAIYYTVRRGHCRSRWLAAGLALLSAVVFYGGYWQVSYRFNVVGRGDNAVALVETESGREGLTGYLIYRTQAVARAGQLSAGRPTGQWFALPGIGYAVYAL